MLYHAKITGRSVIAERTIALNLERPTGFDFIPGQNIDLTLADQMEVDSGDTGRTFSIASAPHEEEIMIGVRLRDNPYKEALETLPIGSDVVIDGPYGLFSLHSDETVPAVFIAGGIGITPILSMLRHLKHTGRSYPLFLFYINRRPEDAAFMDELEQMSEQFPEFRYVPVMSRPHLSLRPWKGLTGYITTEMLAEVAGDLSRPYYYIVGPSRMLWGTVGALSDSVDASRIKAEDFTGF